MRVDRYDPEDIFARVPELADLTDPVPMHLDHLLDDMVACNISGSIATSCLVRRHRLTQAHGPLHSR